jgi:hypothetical protein
VAGDPLYGNAPACGVELVDFSDDLLDDVLPRWLPGVLAGLNSCGLVVGKDQRSGDIPSHTTGNTHLKG